jgi:23S rRNA (cytidine1920-2'-O)/16S rRNA (cytidine1409-2'-O)-methyltransferase
MKREDMENCGMRSHFPFLCFMENQEERLDKILMKRGLAASRERAKTLIESGQVQVDGQLIRKAGRLFPNSVDIILLQEDLPWVSRGALKLLAAIDAFTFQPNGLICMDIGASTGGFTEVLLSKNAKKVFCVDVGHGQLVDKIRNDLRVVNLEKTHVKDLNKNLVPDSIDLCVIDVSFISLEKVLPHLVDFLNPKAQVIALIKPQFEVGKGNLNSKGIVVDEKLYEEVLQRIKSTAENLGFSSKGIIPSPILGGDGNKEFLINLEKP